MYDIDFLLRQYRNDFAENTIKKLSQTIEDINGLEGRFYPAFKDDDLVDENELDNLIIRIALAIENTPNSETVAIIEEAKHGENIVICKDADDLFHTLNI